MEKESVKYYRSYFEKWKIWAAQFYEVNILPAAEFHIVLYMRSYLKKEKQS